MWERIYQVNKTELLAVYSWGEQTESLYCPKDMSRVILKVDRFFQKKYFAYPRYPYTYLRHYNPCELRNPNLPTKNTNTGPTFSKCFSCRIWTRGLSGNELNSLLGIQNGILKLKSLTVVQDLPTKSGLFLNPSWYDKIK